MLSRATMNVSSALQSAQNAEPTSYLKNFVFQGPRFIHWHFRGIS